MDRDKIVERVARDRWEKIVEMIGQIRSWDEIGENERRSKMAHIEDILEAAGYFEIVEAAKGSIYNRKDGMDKLIETMKKDGVWDGNTD